MLNKIIMILSYIIVVASILTIILTVATYLIIRGLSSTQINSNLLQKAFSNKYTMAYTTMDVDKLNEIIASLYEIEPRLYQIHILKIVELRTYCITKIQMIEKFNLK